MASDAVDVCQKANYSIYRPTVAQHVKWGLHCGLLSAVAREQSAGHGDWRQRSTSL